MMKSLLFVVAALMALSAGAQLKSQDAFANKSGPSIRLTSNQPQVQVQEMQMRIPGSPVVAQPRGDTPLEPFYRRPAGAFFCTDLISGDGSYYGSLPDGLILLKPYADYTFHSIVKGADQNTNYIWYVEHAENDFGDFVYDEEDLTVSYALSIQPAPILDVVDGNPDDPAAAWYEYQMPYIYSPSGSGTPVIEQDHYTQVWSVTDGNMVFDEEVDFLLSSKTTCQRGRYHNLNYAWVSYYQNDTGTYPEYEPKWWFGKNKAHYDGMAQAFEKPEHPYMLKKVCMWVNINPGDCAEEVELKCKVYRLDDIEAYRETECVELPEDLSSIGTLIATGKAVVGPETQNTVVFTLLGEEDGLEYEVTPTIDSAILVVVDGYNDPEAAALTDFTAYISNDYLVDEGYGETAYLKTPINDEEGNFTGKYVWKGLNNFFSVGMMKTAFSIFIVADQPYIVLTTPGEYNEYFFSPEGGTMTIDFESCFPGADEGWTLSCNGGEVPDWLSIELYDGEEYGEFNGHVQAEVFAEPLPVGIYNRSAVVRFEIPGAYLDYKFIQGGTLPDPCFPELNISVVNRMIDLMLDDMYDDCYDVNEDGEITVADVNAIIHIILTE